ncbi:MAG: hypothetical protein ACRCYT_00605 [Cetobacterium sp.]
MALENLISIEFSPQEAADIQAAMMVIENILQSKTVNLTPQQRKQYGRVRYEMEVWVNKVSTYMEQNPNLVPSFIDTIEHKKDLFAHHFLNPIIDRIEIIRQMALDSNVLLGADLYNNSMAFYRSIKVSAKSNAPGAATIYKDLSQQFSGNRKKSKD